MDEKEINEFKEIFTAEAKEHMANLNSGLLALEKNSDDPNIIKEIFRASHTLKGMAATMGYEKITNLTHRMEDLLDKIKKAELKINEDVVETLFDCLDLLEALVDEVVTGQDKGLSIEDLMGRITEIAQGAGTVQSDTAGREAANTIDNSQVASQGAATTNAGFQAGQGSVTATAEVKGSLPQSGKVKSESVRIKTEQLDRLLNLVGELVINKARINQLASKCGSPELAISLSHFDRISIELQEEVLRTRMVPVRHIFDRYPRMVRDLAKKLNKEIDFTVSGSEIEIDRTLLEEINEPLVHLLRNAIDHGIEKAAERAGSGKLPVGQIKLTARRDKGYCLIEVSDDGKGLSREKILDKACALKLLTENEVKDMPDTDVFMLICSPSFSLAEKVTDISGRGVGMDVVRSMIAASGGKLEIKSEPGKGTTFTMRLPLTLAIIQSLLILAGGVTYAVPLSDVSELSDLDPGEIKTVEHKEVFFLRNEVIPVIRLKSVFGGGQISESSELPNKLGNYNMPDKSGQLLFSRCPGRDNKGEDFKKILVTEIRGRKVGLLADRLEGQQEIVIKTFPQLVKNNRYFSGATILGDGRVVLIIDVSAMI